MMADPSLGLPREAGPDFDAFNDSMNIFDTALMADFHVANLGDDFWTTVGHL